MVASFRLFWNKLVDFSETRQISSLCPRLVSLEIEVSWKKRLNKLYFKREKKKSYLSKSFVILPSCGCDTFGRQSFQFCPKCNCVFLLTKQDLTFTRFFCFCFQQNSMISKISKTFEQSWNKRNSVLEKFLPPDKLVFFPSFH